MPKFTHLLSSDRIDPIRRKVTVESFPRKGESILDVAVEHEEILNLEVNRSGNLGIIVSMRTKIVTDLFIEEG